MAYPNPGGGSLLARYLTPEAWAELEGRKTRYGMRLAHVIASGLANPDSSVGVYTGDEESYTLFAPLFDPIIADYHDLGPEDEHESDLEPARLNVPNPDPAGRYVVSARIRVACNLCLLPFDSVITRRERRIVEATVVRALENLSGELAGSYRLLYGMDRPTGSGWSPTTSPSRRATASSSRRG